MTPPKNGTCPSIPAGPGENILISNINLAEQASQTFDSQQNGNLMKISWYYNNVRTGGPMDYKNQPTMHAHPEYDALGSSTSEQLDRRSAFLSSSSSRQQE